VPPHGSQGSKRTGEYFQDKDGFVTEEWLQSGDDTCGCCPRWCFCRGSSPSDCQWWKIRVTSAVSLCVSVGFGIRDQISYADPDSNLRGALLVLFIFKCIVLLRGNYNAWKKTRRYFFEYFLWMIMFIVLQIGYVVVSISASHLYSTVLCNIPQATYKGCNLTLPCLLTDNCTIALLEGTGCTALAFDTCNLFRVSRFDWTYVVLQILNTAGTLLPLVPVLQLLTITRKRLEGDSWHY